MVGTPAEANASATVPPTTPNPTTPTVTTCAPSPSLAPLSSVAPRAPRRPAPAGNRSPPDQSPHGPAPALRRRRAPSREELAAREQERRHVLGLRLQAIDGGERGH